MSLLLLRLNDRVTRASHPNASWMAAFAERPLELEPESLGLDAVRTAIQHFAMNSSRDPVKAAEAYAADPGH